MLMLGPLASLAVIMLIVSTPTSRRVNGRHLSRPLTRRLGSRFRAGLVQITPMNLSLILLIGGNLYWAPALLQIGVVVWLLDDLITGGPEDRDGRKREWAKAKLRKIKPVKLRPAERWAPGACVKSVETFLLCSIPFVLVAACWMAARRSSYHRGKSDAFQKVSDDFRGLTDATWMRDKAKQAAERKRLFLSLALCDPRVCEALAEAVTDAREHWNHPDHPVYDALEAGSARVGTVRSGPS